MSDTVHLDLREVRAIAHEVVTDVAGAVSATARALRLPLCPPATDSVTLGMCARADSARLELGLLGDAAADELVRMMEIVVAYVYNAKVLANRTQAAVMGLTTPPVTPVLAASPHRHVSGLASEASQSVQVKTDAEVLSVAVLLAGFGDDDILKPRTMAGDMRAVAARLDSLGQRLARAMSTGDRPAATLRRFASWLAEDYAGALSCMDEVVEHWRAEYARAREAMASSAQAYVSYLGAAVRGQASEPPDAGEARRAVARYAAARIDVVPVSGFPRLGGGGRTDS
jgi:hypothetical protein